MSLPTSFLPEAEDDIEAAFTWYEGQAVGLGERFVEALHEVIYRICEHPQIYGLFHKDIRSAPLKRFPYVVYYRDRQVDVLIVAVQHGRRSFRAWRKRL